jgi:hypothetical protein
MKLYRNGKMTAETESSELRRTWSPGRWLGLSGTINKSGQRHTYLGLEIDADDVIALHANLRDHYKTCVKQRDGLQQRVENLQAVFEKISRLASHERDRSPDVDSLLAAIEHIADHFSFNEQPYRPRFPWLKWKSL